jgi:hypothetical protein
LGIEYEKVSHESQIQGTPDLIWAPCKWVKPMCKMMYGPGFFVFPTPDCELATVAAPNCVYNCLSPWVQAAYEEFLPSPKIPYGCFPMGVEMPPLSTKPRTKVLVYFKHRHPDDLAWVDALLRRRGVAYTLIQYGHYRSEDYGALLDESQFMVVVDGHEAQGFALEEAMARNVPLLVYDVTTMKQEYMGKFQYMGYTETLSASSVPYWDARCGERTTDPNELEAALTVLQSRLETYRPREFIAETLSDEVSFQRILDFVKN